MNDLIERLGRCYTGIVNDVMRQLGERDFVLPPGLTAIAPGDTLCGPAFTVAGRLRPGADPDETLLAWTRLLSDARPGHVWVCQPNTQEIALMGELSAETLKYRGLRGCIVNGGVRDSDFILKLGFPTFRLLNTPADIVGQWLPEVVDGPITIGAVTINPGDLMLADRDGIVRVPAAIASEVATRAIEAIETENQVRTAILSGVDPVEAYRQHRKF